MLQLYICIHIVGNWTQLHRGCIRGKIRDSIRVSCSRDSSKVCPPTPCSCHKHTPLAFHSLQGNTDGAHWVTGVGGNNEEGEVDSLSALARSRKLEVAVSRLRDLAPDVSPGSSLVNRELRVAEIKSKLCL